MADVWTDSNIAHDLVSENTVNRKIRGLMQSPDKPHGGRADGELLTLDEYEERYVKPNGKDRYATHIDGSPSDGSVPGATISYHDPDAFVRDYGPNLDRIGDDSGGYLALQPDGVPASFEARSLPISTLDKPYTQYAFTGHLPDGWKISIGKTAPDFGQPGGSMQVRIISTSGQTQTIGELAHEGVLKQK